MRIHSSSCLSALDLYYYINLQYQYDPHFVNLIQFLKIFQKIQGLFDTHND